MDPVTGDEKDSGPSKADDKMKKAAEPKAKATKSEDTEAQEDQDKIEEEKSDDDDEKEMSDKEMIKAMNGMMKKMNGEQLAAAYEKMDKMEMDMKKDDDDDKKEVDESTIEDRLASVDVSDDVTALTSNEDLSEEFKNKAKTVFEAAIKSKLRSEIIRMEEEKSKSITEEVENVKVELTEKVDNYMNYVVLH